LSENIPAPFNTGLEARDLSCIRGERLVFQNLSFDVKPGDLLAVMGPNGAGKSSLLRLLAGFLEPASGSCIVSNGPVDNSPFHYLGHLDGVKGALSVRENLAFWRDLYGEQRSIEQALAAFGLDRLGDYSAGLLSAGQRRRLALARLAAIARPLWLLDEPTNSLDDENAAALFALVDAHRAKGGAIIMASHQRPPSESYDVLRIEGGRAS
jgi:heme exporter protein A